MIDYRIKEGFFIDNVEEIEYDFEGILTFVSVELGELFVK
jgi:hypothetical protein